MVGTHLSPGISVKVSVVRGFILASRVSGLGHGSVGNVMVSLVWSWDELVVVIFGVVV